MNKKSPKKKETPIYLRFDKTESKENKINLLSFEASTLKVSQSITNYKILRAEELEKKDLIVKKARNLKRDYSNLLLLLPTFTLPKIIKQNDDENQIVKSSKTIAIHTSENSIEEQLLEIQSKLRNLEGY